MTKFDIWWELVKQVNEARREKNEKRNAITTCEWNDTEKSCIKVYQIQSLGVPNENLSDFQYNIRQCDDFSEGHVCKVNCKMHQKNKEYNEALAVFEALRKSRRKAFWDIFIRSK